MNVLLFSGGIESTCLAYMHKPHKCLTVDYGQRQAAGEVRASQNIAAHFDLSHEIIRVDVASLGSGQMAGKKTIEGAAVPELWPFRNQLLITLAAMRFAGDADVRIMIGSTKSDAAHVDGTPAFVEAMGKALFMQEGNVELVAPAIDIESIALLRTSNIDPDFLDMTFSCFQSEYPCGRCRGCLKNESLRAMYYAERPTCTSTS
jgi:7-cyano-7-deazaguanine synthase